jgi:hypothetical protein
MSLFAKKPEKQFVLVPQGTHMARLYSFVHVGTLMEEYMGELKEFNKVRFTFEFPQELHTFSEEKGPQPIVLSQEYNLVMGDKSKLKKLIEGMLGKTFTEDEAYSFDVTSLLGTACLLSVVHKVSAAGNTRAEIASASPLMKGQECPPQVNPTFLLTYQNWNQEKFESLPQFLKDKMLKSREMEEKLGKGEEAPRKKVNGLEYPQEEVGSNIPF